MSESYQHSESNTTTRTFTTSTLQECDLEKWFDFVHSIFKPKATREYFMAHHLNDPQAKASDIMVSINDEKEIVGTVKVFHRLIQINERFGKDLKREKVKIPDENNKEFNEVKGENMIGMCKCLGIGEVSTRSDCRGMGIASSLLCGQVERMKNEIDDELVLSSLHASTDASKLYQKLGWTAIPLHFSKLKFSIHESKSKEIVSSGIRIDETNFESVNVHELYEKYCRYFRFLGTEIRSTEYWNRWVVHESKTHQCKSYALYENNLLKAYIIIGPDDVNKCWKVKEYICDIVESCEKSLEYFFTLVDYAQSQTTQGNAEVSVILPRPVAHFVFNLKDSDIGLSWKGLNHNGIVEEYQECWWTDNGYMYNLVKQPPNILLTDLIEEDKHVVWKTDGF